MALLALLAVPAATLLIVRKPVVVVVVAGLPLAALLVESVALRLGTLVLGALFVLGGSQQVGAAKTIYFLLAIAITVMSSFDLASSSDLPVAERRLLLCQAPLLCAFLLSVVVAHANGTGIMPWFRDAAPYVLLLTAPVNAIAFGRSLSNRVIERLILLSGAIAALGFFVVWSRARGIVSLPITSLALPSASLTIAAVAFAHARWLSSGGRERRWLVFTVVASTILLLTGTRSVLLLLLAIAWVTWRSPHRRVLRRAQVILPVLFVGIVAAVAGRGLLAAAHVDIGKLSERYVLVSQLIRDRRHDQSYIERQAQTRAASSVFHQDVLTGVGPGHRFQYATATGLLVDTPSVDSPYGVLADWGIVGTATIVVSLVGLLLLARSGSSLPPALAMRAYLLVAAVFAVSGSPVEDKGFALAVLLLSAHIVQSVRLVGDDTTH